MCSNHIKFSQLRNTNLPNQLDLLEPVRRIYEEQVLAGHITSDPLQIELVTRLDHLLHEISAKRLSSKSSSLGWLFGQRAEKNPSNSGIYIWGGVGRGKSFLMDLFFDASNTTPKRRMHFNDFMQEAHQAIHQQRQLFKDGKTKEADPIPPVAKQLAAKSKLLCFDEFSVSDIADAMLLGRLFKVLFEEGTIVVATSNISPQDLYKDGLNRQLFLPFIDILQAKMEVFELASKSDYRLTKLPSKDFYSWPLSSTTQNSMDNSWNLLTGNSAPISETIMLKGRQLTVPRAAKGIARFEFDQLCRKPLGVSDYLAIAERYQTIMIDNIPRLTDDERNEAKRLILLIDVLYDNHLRLVVSADGPPEAIYTKKQSREGFEIDRTVSRLIEMQSREYNETCPASP